MMRMRKRRNSSSLMNPASLAISVMSIGAAIWLGKAWGRNSDDW